VVVTVLTDERNRGRERRVERGRAPVGQEDVVASAAEEPEEAEGVEKDVGVLVRLPAREVHADLTAVDARVDRLGRVASLDVDAIVAVVEVQCELDLGPAEQLE
jgi:hypothetical protein